MNALIEILFDLIVTFIPWKSNHEDRSIIGESDLDRRDRNLKIVLVSTLLIIFAGVGLWLYLRK